MSKLRTNTIENLDNTSSVDISDVEIKQESYINLGEYETVSTPVNYNNSVTVDGVVYRLKTSTIAPYTLNGDWAVDSLNFVPIGDDVLRQELASPNGATLIGNGVVAVSSIGDMLAIPETDRRDNLRYLVASYNSGSEVGGGEFQWDPSRADENDGWSVIDGWVRLGSAPITPQMLGAKSDGVTDDTQAIFQARVKEWAVVIPSGDYAVNMYPGGYGAKARTVRGEGVARMLWSHDSAIAWAGFNSDSITENLQFVCTEPMTGVRASIQDASRVTLRNCHFEGFNAGTIQDPTTDAWGLYLKSCRDVVIESPTFADNGQSDIAFVDDVHNVTLINATNTKQTGVSLNIEPNSRGSGSIGVRGLKIIGGKYSHVNLQEPENLIYSSYGVTVDSADMGDVIYGGVGVSFRGCAIGTLRGLISINDQVFAGALEIDNASLTRITPDPSMADTALTGSPDWGITADGAATVTRITEGEERFWRFNPTKGTGRARAFTRVKPSVTPSETLALVIRSRSDNVGSSPSTAHVFNAEVAFFNASDAVIQTQSIRCARTALGTNSGWRTEVAIITPPTDAATCQLFVGKNASSAASTVDVSAAGLFRVTLNVGPAGNWGAVVRDIGTPRNPKVQYRNSAPTDAIPYLVGDRVIRSTPVVGQPKSWVCTVSGSPGTWVSEGTL